MFETESEFRVEVRCPKAIDVRQREWMTMVSIVQICGVEEARIRRDKFLAAPSIDAWEAQIVKVTREFVE